MESIIVTGGRDYIDFEKICDTLSELNPQLVFVGDCPSGVDAVTLDWCKRTSTKYLKYDAEWDTYGLAAGPLRNKQMVNAAKEMKNRMVLAFPGGRGTASCCSYAKKCGMIILKAE